MSIAIGCSIIAYLYATDNVNSEWFHKNAANIFLVEHKAVEEGDLKTFGTTPVPLGPTLLSDHSFITNSTRITFEMATATVDGKEFQEFVQYVDPSFLDMFTFPLEFGEPKSLRNKNSIILSKGTALKLFGTEVPIGKTLDLTFDKDKILFTVTGVAKEFIGPSSCVDFTILANYENVFRNDKKQAGDWNAFTAATFIQVDRPESIAKLSTAMQPYIKLQNAADKTNMPAKSFVFQNLSDVSSSDGVRNSIAGEMSMAPIIVLSSISIFLLLLASFNSININLAAVGARLKEIGIRKVIGGNRSQLVVQFLTENIIVTLLSVIVAVALTGSLLIPAFEDISGAGLTLDLASRLDLWVYMFIIFLIVGVCSGLYPAFYISSFQPIAILRDKLQFGGKSKFMRSLLTIQFVIAFITIITSAGLTVNYIDMQNRDWGYRKENLLTMLVENQAQYNQMKKIAEEQPTISSLTGAKKHVGSYRNTSTLVKVGDVKANAIVFEVAPNYADVMGFEVLAGKLPTTPDAVIVNEKFAKQFSWTNPIGEVITIDSNQYSIAAIVKDFHHDNFMHEVSSSILTLAKEETFTTLVMRVDEGAGRRTRATLEAAWKKHFPDSPLGITTQEETFNDMYYESKGILRLFTFVMIVALFMAAIGLFGLASQRLQSKQKEICIRKIFGVPLTRAVLLVNGNFLLLIGIAAVIASPLSYLILNELLDSIYKFRMDVGGSPFLISYILMAVTIAFTLTGKIIQIARVNPANILRSE
jgi:putative ABC transport system permease protein